MLVQNQINNHQGSSPTTIFIAVKQMAKGLETIAHSVTLLTADNHNLRKANEALSKHRRAKKTRVREGDILTVEDARDLLAQKEAKKQAEQDRRENGSRDGERPADIRRCSKCESGHNARTCQIEV